MLQTNTMAPIMSLKEQLEIWVGDTDDGNFLDVDERFHDFLFKMMCDRFSETFLNDRLSPGYIHPKARILKLFQNVVKRRVCYVFAGVNDNFSCKTTITESLRVKNGRGKYEQKKG